MKIAELDNIVCLDINTLPKYNLIKDKLDMPILSCIKAAPYFDKTLEEYQEILRYQIEAINNRFKLVIALDRANENELVFFGTFFVIQEDSGPACLIYSIYAKPGFVVPIADIVLKYIDHFAMKFKCNKMIFYTDASRKAFEKLGRKYKWKLARLVFERRIEP